MRVFMGELAQANLAEKLFGALAPLFPTDSL